MKRVQTAGAFFYFSKNAVLSFVLQENIMASLPRGEQVVLWMFV